MRPVLPGDVSSAARALLAAPRRRRRSLARILVAQARAADAHVRATGQMHPHWGSGSLMSAALRCPVAPEPTYDDAAYAACTIIVLQALHEADHKIAQNLFNFAMGPITGLRFGFRPLSAIKPLSKE